MIRAMVAELPRHSVRTPSYFTVRYRKRNAALKEYCFCETGGKRNIFSFDLTRRIYMINCLFWK